MSKVVKRTIGLALTLVLALALTACATPVVPEPEHDPEVAVDLEVVPTDVSTLPTIKLGALDSDDLLPLMVAQHDGLLEQSGLNVEIERFAGIDGLHVAITSGDIDALVTDIVDVALLTSLGNPLKITTSVYQVLPADPTGTGAAADGAEADVATDGSVSLETTPQALHETLFDLPSNMVTMRVLAFSQSFILGNTASGETTSIESAAEAISTLNAVLTEAAARVDSSGESYRQQLLDAGVPAQHIFELAPSYPLPALIGRERDEALLRWLYDNNRVPVQLSYDDLIFIPGTS
ncbi:MAG: hypothetical protein FWE51_02140 [Coriobacteriia bacterium]|nr:hypothetical protein [Coriobacteriia bacterium]